MKPHSSKKDWSETYLKKDWMLQSEVCDFKTLKMELLWTKLLNYITIFDNSEFIIYLSQFHSVRDHICWICNVAPLDSIGKASSICSNLYAEEDHHVSMATKDLYCDWFYCGWGDVFLESTDMDETACIGWEAFLL